MKPPRRRQPGILSQAELKAFLEITKEDPYGVAMELLCGTGIRRVECVRVRVGDIDLEGLRLIVRDEEGDERRVVPLPKALRPRLRMHLKKIKAVHDLDRAAGLGEIDLPGRDAAKKRRASREWKWQFAFPAQTLSLDSEARKVRRYAMHPNSLQQAVIAAGAQAHIDQRVTCATLRYTFGAHMLDSGKAREAVQLILGHSDSSAMDVYGDRGR